VYLLYSENQSLFSLFRCEGDEYGDGEIFSYEQWPWRLELCPKFHSLIGFKFDIKDVMLDQGSDVNILPKKTREALGKPRLTYSPIQLRMENQYCILRI
jgi:hypothetical protein